jgi:hypothetical protein
MTFPTQHRAKLHSTNPIERLNGEIKRHTAHRPPRAVAIPRAFQRLSNGRSDVAPAFCISQMMGSTFSAACRSGLPSATSFGSQPQSGRRSPAGAAVIHPNRPRRSRRSPLCQRSSAAAISSAASLLTRPEPDIAAAVGRHHVNGVSAAAPSQAPPAAATMLAERPRLLPVDRHDSISGMGHLPGRGGSSAASTASTPSATRSCGASAAGTPPAFSILAD